MDLCGLEQDIFGVFVKHGLTGMVLLLALIFIVWREIAHGKERDKLADRLEENQQQLLGAVKDITVIKSIG